MRTKNHDVKVREPLPKQGLSSFPLSDLREDTDPSRTDQQTHDDQHDSESDLAPKEVNHSEDDEDHCQQPEDEHHSTDPSNGGCFAESLLSTAFLAS